MKKIIKNMLLVLLAVLIIIQFFRPAENKNEEIAKENITANFHIPDSVQKLLKASCYDCHSNTTFYPAYFKIQPVAWFLDKHIRDGKRHLNFSTFSTYALWQQNHKLEEIVEQVKENEMPLTSYTIIHHEAKLTADQKLTIENWANDQMKMMESKYPADSLARPKRR
jgi:hypothetical protein